MPVCWLLTWEWVQWSHANFQLPRDSFRHKEIGGSCVGGKKIGIFVFLTPPAGHTPGGTGLAYSAGTDSGRPLSTGTGWEAWALEFRRHWQYMQWISTFLYYSNHLLVLSGRNMLIWQVITLTDCPSLLQPLMFGCCQCSTELTRLTQEYSIRTQLEVFCKDKTSKEEQIRRLWVV